ncbi:hypothetical protein EON80_08750 [bacterium]|nr:MAG: hypothetical protein EON80_08750 [bacterium]
MYEKGLSLREIEAHTGYPKTSIREALTASGMALKASTKILVSGKTLPSSRRPPVCPYGYDWLEGRLVVVPAEYRVVTRILTLWKSGKSLHSISAQLNAQRIHTRAGNRWFHSSVSQVVKRHTNMKN